jgi:hypothetical protein
MIVANFPYGRLGNQLELAAHLIVFAETEKKVISLEYLRGNAKNFPYFQDNLLNIYPKQKKSLLTQNIIKKTINKIIQYKLIKTIDFIKKNEWIYFDDISSVNNKELKSLRKSRLCTIKVWRFRSKYLIKNYRNIIKEIFRPSQDILDKGHQFIKQLNADIVVGVHIRWGDYKTEAPSLFHSIEIYKARMLETQKLYSEKKVGFIVCSEEGEIIKELSELNCIFPQSDAITDLYTLAQCDYLIATASTFSSWASYWGDVGLFTINDKCKEITDTADFLINDLIVEN